MISGLIFAIAMTASQTPAWAWTLYEGAGPVVLANERPDTPDLRSTFECVEGSGQARVAIYEAEPSPGPARLESAGLSAAVVAISTADGGTAAAIRVDSPVFVRFVQTGTLTFAFGERNLPIDVSGPDIAKLRRFSDLCRG